MTNPVQLQSLQSAQSQQQTEQAVQPPKTLQTDAAKQMRLPRKTVSRSAKRRGKL